MDPQACWNEIKSLLAELDAVPETDLSIYASERRSLIEQEIVDQVRNLAEWVGKGGFWPKESK